MSLFVCTVTDFSAAEKERRETSHASSTTIRDEFLPFGELWPRSAVWWDLCLVDTLVHHILNVTRKLARSSVHCIIETFEKNIL